MMTPRRSPMVRCANCGRMNDPARGSKNCWYCGAELPQAQASEIAPFEFPATGQPVRTLVRDGEPWFVGRDAATILGYTNTRKAIRDHVPAGHRRGNESFPLAELGLDPQTVLISEAGLYRLIMRSNTALAEPFQEWVTAEVLPAIRETGSYSVAAYQLPQTFAEALRAYAAEVESHEVTKGALAEAAPKAESWEVLAEATGDYSVREAAQILNRDPHINTGQNRLFKTMHDIGWIDSRGEPYQRHVDADRLRRRTLTYKHPHTGDPVVTSQVRITAKGLSDLRKWFGNGQLELIGGA